MIDKKCPHCGYCGPLESPYKTCPMCWGQLPKAEMKETIHVPRHDIVVLRLTRVTASQGGVIIPEKSEESYLWHVVRVGPEVKDLCPGDQVEVVGTIGQDITFVPRSKNLLITKEANILLVIRQEEEAAYPNSYDHSDMDC